jgi:hypothetical protein
MTAALAATVATTVWSGPSRAENLDLEEMAAAIAFPVITGGQKKNPIKNTNGDVIIDDNNAVTLITITNGKSDPIRLKIDVISGDTYSYYGGDQWQSNSFDCDLTGRETTVFVIVEDSDGSKLYAECSNLLTNDTEGVKLRKFLLAQNGIFFAAVADPASSKVISEDVIFGDAIVVDVDRAQAYSFGGIPFQAGKGQNSGDKVYKFDDVEYTQFPAVLATNFLAPTDYVEGELILFTIDGTTGDIPVPRVKLGGYAFNDDEEYFDFQYEFDCFDVVSLEDLDPNFFFQKGIGFGSMVGHLELTPQPIGANGFSAHDAMFGDANNIRRRAAHGWIVQATDGTFVQSDEPVWGTPSQSVSGDAAWGRELHQSTTALRPFLGDKDSTFNADTRL